MRLAVFGASGETGERVVQQALNKGHHVVAIVRNPKKIKIKHEKLQIRKADIFNSDDLADHVASSDAIISCLGSTEYKLFSDITVYSDSCRAIVGAMRKANLRRLVGITSWFVTENSDHPWPARFFVKPLMSRYYADMTRMERYLMNECPDIDFTVVRPPNLNTDHMDGRDLLVKPDADFIADLYHSMPRGDLAAIILRIVEESLYQRKCVAVGLPQKEETK